MADGAPSKGFFTKRMLFSLIGLTVASVALFTGKMADHVWVYSLAVVIAGHHAVDIVKAWKGGA
jgi:FtsH-binding integral membrane protein